MGDRGSRSMHATEPRKKKPSMGLQGLNANLYEEILLNYEIDVNIIIYVVISFKGGILCGF
jgi:hypothetical protein